MSQAEDLLSAIAETVTYHEHSVTDSDSYFIIDPDTRIIRNTSGSMNVLMQGDHESERYTFELERYIEGHDMSLCNVVKVHYTNADTNGMGMVYSDVYDIDDLQVNPEDRSTVICSWLIKRESTQLAGNLSFSLQYQCVATDGTVTYEFNTDEYTDVEVKATRRNEQQSVGEYSDIIESWRAKLFGTGDTVISDIQAATDEQIERVTEAGQTAQDALTEVKAIVAGNEAYTKYESDRKYGTAIIGTMSGKSMVATDASACPFAGLKQYGKTTQFTTSGAQLIPYPHVHTTRVANGITFTDNGDGTITVNGTASADTTYTIYGDFSETGDILFDSGVKLVGCPTGGSIATYMLRASNVIDVAYNDVGNGVTIKSGVRVICIMIKSGVTVSNLIFKPMITTDITATYDTYEPYTGGVASPNPDYPQELKSLGEWGNLCNLPDVEETTLYGITWSCKNGVVAAKGTSTAVSSSSSTGIKYHLTGLIGTFFVSGDTSKTKVHVRITKADGTIVHVNNSSFTLDGTETEVFLFLQVGSSGTQVDEKIYPMLNHGTTALPYRPYTGEKEKEIEVEVFGKNFASENTILGIYENIAEFPVPYSGKITIAVKTVSGTSQVNYCLVKENGVDTQHTMLIGTDVSNNKWYTKTITPNVPVRAVRIYNVDSSNSRVAQYIMVLLGEHSITSDADFEPYTSQSLITPVSDGLPGIPLGATIPDAIANSDIHMSGVWYDEDEEQYYISDTVDYETGKYVQRLARIAITSDLTFLVWATQNKLRNRYMLIRSDILYDKNNSQTILSNAFIRSSMSDVYTEKYSEGVFVDCTSSSANLYIGFCSDKFPTLGDFKTFLSENEVYAQYILATPIETDLSAEEIVAFQAIHTNKPNTTVFNDCDAMMEMGYVADTKTHIDQNYISKTDYDSLVERIAALEAANA